MTRFARAEGSKASNKKKYEDSTPWEVFQEQRCGASSNPKEDKSVDTSSNNAQNAESFQENEKSTHEEKKCSSSSLNSSSNNDVAGLKSSKKISKEKANDLSEIIPKKSMKRKPQNNHKSGDDDSMQFDFESTSAKLQDDDSVQLNAVDSSSKASKNSKKKDKTCNDDENELQTKKSKKRKLKNISLTDSTEEKVKACEDESAQFESEIKTIKTKKKKHKNNSGTDTCEDVSAQFESEIETKKTKKNKLKNNSGTDTTTPKSKYGIKSCDDDTSEFDFKHKENSDKLNKKKKQKECNNFVYENGMRFKVVKKLKNNKKITVKKPWFDLPYEENKMMTKYNKFFVAREAVEDLNKLKASLQEEGLNSKVIASKLLHSERKAHNKLRVHLLREQIKKVSGTNKSDDDNDNKNTCVNSKKPELKYEENDFMTQYNGFWVKKESVAKLDDIHKMKTEELIKNRTDGNLSSELTEEEKLKLNRDMKKEKRREMRLLNMRLYKQQGFKKKTSTTPQKKTKPKKPGKYLGIDFKKKGDKMVKFEGFYVKPEAAERLSSLKEKLKSEGISEEEIKSTLKNERRKEERCLKKENKIYCFKCRRYGHMVSQCPDNPNFGQTGLCYRCGSAEHIARECNSSKRDSGYNHATCFYCGGEGHIARQCPDNPNGLYPNGGGCNHCGSVEHFWRDCSKFHEKRNESTITLPKLDPKNSVEIESYDNQESAAALTNKKSKHVVFE